MTFIGLSSSSEIGRLGLIHRWLSYIFVVAVQVCLVVHLFLNVDSITSSYSEGNFSTALAFNYKIDAVNFAAFAIGCHTFLLILMIRPQQWNKLMDSFVLPGLEMSSVSEIHTRCKKLSIVAVAYTFFSVRI